MQRVKLRRTAALCCAASRTTMAAHAQPPKPRIVSLLPSATELVFTIGAGDCLVGRSHECDFPPSVRTLPALTSATLRFSSSRQINDDVSTALGSGRGLYAIDEELLRRLRPDVIVTQSLCSVCSVDLALVERAVAGLSPPPHIVCLNPWSLQEVIQDCLAVAPPGWEAAAEDAARRLRERVAAVTRRVSAALEQQRRQLQEDHAGRAPSPHRPNVAFLEWVSR